MYKNNSLAILWFCGKKIIILMIVQIFFVCRGINNYTSTQSVNTTKAMGIRKQIKRYSAIFFINESFIKDAIILQTKFH